jgi:hypothetical protein
METVEMFKQAMEVRKTEMVEKIKKALEAAGYDEEPTPENLRECFLDYADAYGGELDQIKEDIADGTITLSQMCNALIRG